MPGKIDYTDDDVRMSRPAPGHEALVRYLVDMIGSEVGLAKLIGVHRNSVILWLKGGQVSTTHLKKMIAMAMGGK